MRLKRSSPTLTGLVQAAATIIVLFSLATFADQWHRYLELFSHFRLQYLVAALILAMIFAVLRRRRWAILMLAVTVLNTIPVAPWYFSDTQENGGYQERLLILFANVNSGNQNTMALLEVVESEQPDLIVLQEVSYLWATAMESLQAEFPHSHVIPRNDNFGIAIYSRQPLLDIDVLSGAPLGFPSLVVQQVLGSSLVTYVTTHPIPPLGKLGFDARNEQLAVIGERIVEMYGPIVLIGDLNMTMWGHHYKTFVNDIGLSNTRDGFGVIPTWPRQLPFAMIPIDHCLVSDDFVVLDIRSGPDIGSDHLPLIVTLGLL